MLASPHHPTNNFVAANQVTAQARAEAFLLAMSLNAVQTITDGCTYRADQIPAVPFAECVRRQPDYPVRRAEADGPVPFLPAEQVPAGRPAFTDWYRSHARWFFGDTSGCLDRLVTTHELEHKQTDERAAFDLLLCDGAGNYVKAHVGPDGHPVATDSALRGYGKDAKKEITGWMMKTYPGGNLTELPPVTGDRELLSLRKACRKARAALRGGVAEVRLPLAFEAGKVLTFRAVKASAYVFQDPAQRAVFLKHLQAFEERTRAGLEALVLRRSYDGRKRGDLIALLEQLYRYVRNGGRNLNREFHLGKPGAPVEEAVAGRHALVERMKAEAEERLFALMALGEQEPDPYTGLVVAGTDLEVRMLG